MTPYVTATELEAGLPADLRSEWHGLESTVQQQLLEDASADVDRAIGGPRDPATGRAVALGALLASQATATRRATVEAAAFRLADAESVRGGTEYVPNAMADAWRGPRPPSAATIRGARGSRPDPAPPRGGP